MKLKKGPIGNIMQDKFNKYVVATDKNGKIVSIVYPDKKVF